MHKLRVLIVDDDELVCTQLTGLLSDAGHVAHSLPSAIGASRAILHHQIDVVAIDVMMPSLPGDKLAALLRQNPRFKNLGVILISSRPVDELQQLAREVSADAIVTKAALRSDFVGAVARAASLRGRG
jgi:twitching motility two-component system response regulator PilG